MDLLWTALILGLAGSLHCIGMCGPIAIALPVGNGSRFNYTVGRIAYNLGRSVTYALLGLFCGFVGKTILMAGYQQVLSIALGVLILLAVLLPSGQLAKITGLSFHARLVGRLQGLWARVFSKSSINSLFVVGLLNGFLPCGLVYVALAGSVATASPLYGAAYMGIFGLGTLPVMFAMAMLGRVVGSGFRSRLRRVVPVVGVLLAALFILRGLSLGIPFVSPKLGSSPHGQATMDCCQPGDHEETPVVQQP
jgi:hypothetical protein